MICVQTKEDKAKHILPTIRRIPDELWDEFKVILPREKPPKTVGRLIIPYKQVLDGILYAIRTGCDWKMLPKEYSYSSVCHRRSQEWDKLHVFKNTWIKLLEVYNAKISINWTWQSIDSMSIVTFRETKTRNIPTTNKTKLGTKRQF
ncbi:MAG: transposase [Candidatus Nitrosocosmicus sp.]